ncbi:MAG: bacterial Ig-like domain-containing protein [Bacilli bacterium]|nr:bacterial Ig-like domain-containing protein [Bacilli bacterium]
MNKRSTYKTIYFIIISLFILINPLFVNAENLTYTEAQNMVKEVMKQYYVRGPYFQYNYAKAEYYNLAPEEGTLQDNKYTVCAGYTHNVYNQAFGILGSTKYMSADNTFKENAFPRYNYHIIYAGQHAYKKIKSGGLTDDGNLLLYYESTTNEKDTGGDFDRTRSVVRFVTGDTNTSSNSGDLARIIKKVKPGDLFVYTGHALIAYDTIDKDGDGTKDDVLILEATGGGNEIHSRIPGTSRLYYTAHKSEYEDALKYLNLEEEGIFRIVLLSSIKKFVTDEELDCKEEECAIIRPFYKGSNSEAVFNFQQTISKTDTAVKKSAIRVKYPSLHIEKTVSKGDNNSIYIGDELTYTIKVTNRSDITPTTTTYPAFTINETLDSNVTCTDCTGWTVSGTSITQTVSQKLAPGESITLTYTVKVKDDVSVVGETITSTGSFYDTSTNKGILGTGTVENKVIPKVVNYIDTYANCYDTYKDTYKGLTLIDYIYSCALGKEFNFSEFKFSSLLKTSDPSKSGSKIEYVDPLDENHTQFQKMILNNYISGLAPTADTTPIYYFPRFTSTNITRAKTINAIDFNEGDVLIYDIAANDYTHENGTYAYIYKGGTFVGVNGSGMTVRNAFNTTYHSYAYWNDQGISDYLNVTNSLYKYDDSQIWSGFTTAEKKHILYQSLYGKDNYVILRPELAIKEVVEVEITANPTKTTYIQNYGELNLTGGTIKVTYNDGTTATKNMSEPDVTVEGFSNTTTGPKELTVTHGGKSDTFTVNVVEKSATKIEVTTKPTKTSYIQNYETLNLTGGKIKVTYNDNSTETINMTDSNVTVTSFDNTTTGTKTLTVTYKKKTATFTVSVVAKSISKIEVTSNPSKTTYIQNYETLNLVGGKIKATYNDTSTETIDMTNTNVSVTGFSNTTLGEVTLTVTYKSKTTTFKVSIVAKSISKIEVVTKPTKTSYIQNYEALNLAGGKIKATYNDTSTETIDMTDESVTVTGFDNSTLGTNTLTVSYKGKTTTFTVTIVAKSVSKIEVITNPTKTSYIQNYENLDLTSGTIKVTYNDKSTATKNMSDEGVTVTGFSNTTVGEKTLTVSYQEKTATFTVTVVAKSITKIEVSTKPTKTTYIQNYETLNLAGGKIKATYNDTSTEIIDMTNTNVSVTGFSNTTLGDVTLTVTYKSKTTTFKVSIVTKLATKIEVTSKPTKTSYIQNYENLNLTGGKIKVTYNDNSTETVNMTDSNVTVTGFDNTTTGTKTLTVKYKDVTTTFTVTVVAKSVTKIEITSNPSKTTYIQNYENLNLSGGKIKVTYNDTSTETINMTNTNVSVTGFSNSTVGEKTLTVTYKSKTATFKVNIVAKSITKIEVSSLPTKTSYIQNKDTLNLSGGKIKATYNDTSTETINMTDSNVSVTGFSNTTLGEVTLTVTYKTKTTTFKITIVDKVTLKETFINKGYKAKDNYIHGFEIGELLTDLKNTIQLDYQTNGKTKVATGIEFKYNTETLIAVVYGDLNGDGIINSADLLRMRQHLLNLNPLTGAYKEAGLIENKTTINSADLLRIRQHLLNIRLIQQQ